MSARPRLPVPDLALLTSALPPAAAPAGEPVKIGFFMAFSDRDASFDSAHLTSPR